MKKIFIYILILLSLDIIAQDGLDFSKATVTKTKKIKLKSPTINSPVYYDGPDHNYTFDKQDITTFISDLRCIEKFKSFNFDSLQKATLTTNNGTIEFNKFADNFDPQIVNRFLSKLIIQDRTNVKDKFNKPVKTIKRIEWDQVFGNCLHSGYAYYINDKYLFHVTTAQGRILN